MSYRDKKAAILGSTGSVGTQAVDALCEMAVKIVFLSGGKNIKLLSSQINRLRPAFAAVPDEDDAAQLRLLCPGFGTRIYGGENAVTDCIKECGADIFVHAISGMAGIPAALAAADTGARIAMANKEAIISLGHIIYSKLEKSGGQLIPVDSEHSAIFQCLRSQGASSPNAPADSKSVRRILLTASGGPFFGKSRNELMSVTPEMALAHPTWKMGPKITVDSATLMNKGFELIEACRLFGVSEDRIEVIIHRQSIIHSMVEFCDTSVIAQLSNPDMRDCVRYALTYPEREPFGSDPIDFAALGKLTFDAPDTEVFPLLDTARRAWRRGGCAPAALIAADEVAVAAFLEDKLPFHMISEIVAETLEKLCVFPADSEEAVLYADKEAREAASAAIVSAQKA